MTKFLITMLSVVLIICASVYGQLVDIRDPNLRAAIRETLNLPDDAPITQAAMLHLDKLDNAFGREITNLFGLQFAINLEYLELSNNPISDITPLVNLTKLRRLFAWKCQISDINPLTNLTELRYLDLSYNHIVDITALAGMTEMIGMLLVSNNIRDVTPLANMARLEDLDISHNQIFDYTPLDGLSLINFRYDETCDMPSLPLQPRLDNKTYPSLFQAWGSRILNRPDLSDIENEASHDLWFHGPQQLGLSFQESPSRWEVRGQPGEAVHRREKLLAINPNMVFLVDIRMREFTEREVPEDWPYWIRDISGERVSTWPGTFLVDFTQPEVQDRIVQQALAVSKCGLYDGVFFDHWDDEGAKLEGYVPLEAEQRARDIIMERIRAETRPDFLIMGNNNHRVLLRTGKYINGSFMEIGVPYDLTEDQSEYWLNRVERSLKWLEQNLRESRINALEGQAIPTEPFDSPSNLRWMRIFTTLSLTHSDGYFLFRSGAGHNHYWYDFWDADLGRPVGPKSQLYDQKIPGLYIREFTNGWAVYNHSGDAQEITSPEEVQGVANGQVNTEHTLPNLDGEIYLRVKPANPADVNGDGVVNILDLTIVAQAFGTGNAQGDVNGDGVINVFDLVFVANQF